MTPAEILNNEHVKRAIEIVGPVEWKRGRVKFRFVEERKLIFCVEDFACKYWSIRHYPTDYETVCFYQSAFIERLNKWVREKPSHSTTDKKGLRTTTGRHAYIINFGGDFRLGLEDFDKAKSTCKQHEHLTIALAMAVCGVKEHEDG